MNIHQFSVLLGASVFAGCACLLAVARFAGIATQLLTHNQMLLVAAAFGVVAAIHSLIKFGK